MQEAELVRIRAEQGSLEVQREEAAQATQRMERMIRGLDLCFLFDVTGSMVSMPSFEVCLDLCFLFDVTGSMVSMPAFEVCLQASVSRVRVPSGATAPLPLSL